MNDDHRVRWRAGGLLALTFVAGAIAGGTVVHSRTLARQERAPAFGLQRATVLGTGTFLPPGYAELGLTDRQRHDIRAILEDTRPRTDSILRQTLPVMRETMDSMQARMRAVLTPDQRRRLDEMPAAGVMTAPSTMRAPGPVQEP